MTKKFSLICAGALLCCIGSLSAAAQVLPPITVQASTSEVLSSLVQAGTDPGRKMIDNSGPTIVVDTAAGSAKTGSTASALRTITTVMPAKAGGSTISVSMQLIENYGTPEVKVAAVSGTKAGESLDAHVNDTYAHMYCTFNTYYAYGFQADARDKTISAVQSNSPAEKAGLKTGDKILSLNGKDAASMKEDEFRQLTVHPFEASTLQLTVEHSGSPVTVSLTSKETKYSLSDQAKAKAVSPF